MANAEDFVRTALTQTGKRYIYGAEASPSNPSPSAFDCSELVEWSLGRIGLRFVDGAENQYNTCRRAGMLLSVEQGINTRGALLFKITPGNTSTNSGDHVGISQGDGRTIEARGRAYGVGQWSARSGRAWTHAGRVPGLTYGVVSNLPVASQEFPATDSDRTNYDYNAGAAALRWLARVRDAMRVTLRMGSSGDAVTVLQSQFQQFGFPLDVTGRYDSYTRSCVQVFQVFFDLRSDGVVDQLTWTKMYPDIAQYVYG